MYNYFRLIYDLVSLIRHCKWKYEELVDYQNKKLREIVKYAYNHVPFYRSIFRKLNLKPEEIRSVEDLKKLPIIRKEELRTNVEKVISNEFSISNLLAESTSGTTGQPLTYYLTRSENEFRKAKLLRANICCGQKPRDRWVVITSPFHAKRSNMAPIQKHLGIFTPITASVFDPASELISFVNHVKPDILEGYSSSLLLMAKELEKGECKVWKPRLVIGGADMLGDYEQNLIEKVFNAPFYDQYAINELEALAWQCEEKSEYHIDADTIIMEFVDENGEKVAPGESGEIVCTSLFNYAMPFIRYAVGDVGVLSNDKCSCGRSFPLMKLVEGRKDSFIVIPSGPIFSPQAFLILMREYKFFNCIDRYRIIQKKIDLIKIYLKLKKIVDDKETLKFELINHFRRALNISGDDLTFEVEFVEELPLSKSGKLAAVVSELTRYEKI